MIFRDIDSVPGGHFGRYKTSAKTRAARGTDTSLRNPPRARVQSSVDPELYEAIRRRAIRQNKSIDAVVRHILECAIYGEVPNAPP